MWIVHNWGTKVNVANIISYSAIWNHKASTLVAFDIQLVFANEQSRNKTLIFDIRCEVIFHTPAQNEKSPS